LNPSCKILEKISGTVQHQLTHRTIHARFIHVSLDRWPEPQPQGWIRTPLDRLDDFPIPRLIHRYLEVVKI
jgi:hypothetical protein